MTTSQIVIVDYGMGNLRSVVNAFEHVGAKVKLSSHARDVAEAGAVVVPGQGAFRDCMASLKKHLLVDALNDIVLKKRRPYFGICLGMQVLADKGHEGGKFKGLGWISGQTVRLSPKSRKYKVPHLGWNDVTLRRSDPLFKGLEKTPCFYFAHSYHLQPDSVGSLLATSDYGEDISAAVRQDNIVAVQFHPEKSQQAGLRLIDNFVQWVN